MIQTLTTREIHAAAARERATAARLRAELAANCAKSIEYAAAARLARKGAPRPVVDCEETSEKLLRALEHAHAMLIEADTAEHFALELERDLQGYQPDQDFPMTDVKSRDVLRKRIEFSNRAAEFAATARLQSESASNYLRRARSAAEAIDGYNPRRAQTILSRRPRAVASATKQVARAR